eukprot:m.250489 g.250489  ORF g.250489 m.250489 type:complete len:282 (-) comp54507_c0_seq19:259-1104(-)
MAVRSPYRSGASPRLLRPLAGRTRKQEFHHSSWCAHFDGFPILTCPLLSVLRFLQNSSAGPASLVEVLREFAGPMPLPWIPQSAVGRLHIITILRNPVDRFLSEFLHTVTGWGKSSTTDPRPAFFVEADFHCDGSRALRNVSCRTEIRSDRRLTRGQILQELGLRDKSASQQALNRTRHLPNVGSETKQPYFDDVLLSEYLFCSHNDAINRQVLLHPGYVFAYCDVNVADLMLLGEDACAEAVSWRPALAANPQFLVSGGIGAVCVSQPRTAALCCTARVS